nr:hypothetical protein [Tanacetum cinerariifolium]
MTLTDNYYLTSAAVQSSQQWHLFSSGSGTFFTGSGNFFCQWELHNWQWECLNEDHHRTTRSQPKLTGKSVQSKEMVFKAVDTKMPLNQGDDMGNTDAQLDLEAVIKDDWLKKSVRPHTPDPE